MAYNLAQFNLTAFNAASKVKWLMTRFTEDVDISIGADNNTYLNTIYNERVDKQVDGLICKYITSEGAETVDEIVSDMIAVIWMQTTYNEAVDTEVEPSAEVYLTTSYTEQVNNNTHLGQDVYLDAQYEENVDSDTHLGLNLYLETEGYELISESASLVAIDEKFCYIGTAEKPFTLKPGKRLVIDAGTYNLLLNGANIIEYHSGEWLDGMNRNTLNIDITASSGLSNLSATILYTELYL